MHKDIFTEIVKYERRDTFARRLFCTKVHFSRGFFLGTRVKKLKNKKP